MCLNVNYFTLWTFTLLLLYCRYKFRLVDKKFSVCEMVTGFYLTFGMMGKILMKIYKGLMNQNSNHPRGFGFKALITGKSCVSVQVCQIAFSEWIASFCSTIRK